MKYAAGIVLGSLLTLGGAALRAATDPPATITPAQRAELDALRVNDPVKFAAVARETPAETYDNWKRQAPHVETMKVLLSSKGALLRTASLRAAVPGKPQIGPVTATAPLDMQAIINNAVFLELARGQTPIVPPGIQPPPVVPPVVPPIIPPVTPPSGTPVYNGDHPGALPSDATLKAAPYWYPSGKMRCTSTAAPQTWTVTQFPHCGFGYADAGTIQ